MDDSGSRNPHDDDTPDGDPLRVGRGLIGDSEDPDGSSERTLTAADAIDLAALEHTGFERQIDRESEGARDSLATPGLGIHVMDSDGIDSATE